VRLEHPLQITVGRRVRQIADVQLLTHDGTPLQKTPCQTNSPHNGREPAHRKPQTRSGD
jgi:hypothetical protein